ATYAPSRFHTYLLQAPPIALESAFMSMCHFCYRCRRPSCPNCWDDVHGICAQCSQETHVPFREESQSLDGISLLPTRSSPSMSQRSVSPSLVSIRPGRFQEVSAASADSVSTWSASSPMPQTQFTERSAETFVVSSPADIDRIETRPERVDTLDIDSVETRPDRAGLLDVDKIETRPDPAESLNIDRIKTRPDSTGSVNVGTREAHPDFSIVRKRRSGRIFTILVFLLIFLIAVMIAVSLLSADVNLFIYQALHVDIRAELSYLWHFLRGFF
ncbi:MAG: hypothetical protein JO031_11985, partial [Ktedonobacteraceae bacterium]|nr:hypothetical protein [Ktedonobacteraceae bacterium]